MASCALKSKLEQQKKELRELLVYSKNELVVSEILQSRVWLDDSQKDKKEVLRALLGSEIEKMITAEVKWRKNNIYKYEDIIADENATDDAKAVAKKILESNTVIAGKNLLAIRNAINNDAIWNTAKLKMSTMTVTNPDEKFKVLDLSFKKFEGKNGVTLFSAMSEMLREINGPKFDEKQAKMKKEVMALQTKEQDAITNKDADLANKYAAQKDRLLARIDGTALKEAILSIGGLHDNSENFPKIFATTQKYDSKKVDPATGEMPYHESASISALTITDNTLDAKTVDGSLVSSGLDEVSTFAMLFNFSGNIIELPDYAKNVIKIVSLESMEDVYKMLGYEPRTKEFDDVWGLDRTDPEYDSYLAAAEEAHLNGYIPQATIITSLGKAVYRGLPVQFSKELDVELEQKAIAQLGMYTLQYMTNIKLISRQDQIVKFGENKSHILIRANNSNSKKQPEVRADKIMALVSELQYLGISERRNAPRRYVEGETYQVSQTIRNSFLPTSEEVRDSLRAYESTRFKFNDHMQLLYDVYMNPKGGKEAAYAMAGVLEVDKSKSAIDQMKELAKINYAKMQIDEMMKVYEEFGSDTEFTLPYDYTVSGRYMVNSIFNPQESKISRFLVTTKDIDSTIRRGEDRKLNTEDKQIFEVGLAQSFDLDPDKTTDENAIAALSKIVTISEYGAVKFTDMYKGKPNPFKAVYDMLDGALEGDVTEDMQKALMAANRAGSGFHAIQAIMALKQLDKASKEKLDNSEIKLSFSLESDAITSGMILTLMQIGTPRAMALAAKGGVYTKETIAHWKNLYEQYRTIAIVDSMDALQDKNGDFKLTHGWLKEFSKDFTKKVKESNIPEEQKAALIKAGAFSDFYETVAVTANEEMQVIAKQIDAEIKETDKKIEAETDDDKKAVLIKARAELVNAQHMTKMIGQVKRSLAKSPVMVYIYGAMIDSIKKKMLDSIVMPKIYDILLSDTLSKVKYPDLLAVLFTLEGGRNALIASLAKEAMAKDEEAEAQVVLDSVTAQVEILAAILDPSKGDPKVEFKVIEDNAIKNDEHMFVRNMIIPETASMRIKKAVDATLGKSFEKGFSEFDEIDAYRDSVKVAEVVRFTMFKYKLNKGINKLINRLKAGPDGEYKISARDISIVISELEASGFGHSVNDINGGKQPLYKKDVLEKEIRTVLSLVAKEKGKQSVFSFALEGKSFVPNTGASGVITVHNIDGFIDSVSARMFDLIRIYDGSVSGINALDGSVTAYNKTVLETTGWNSYGKQVNDLAKQIALLKESGELYDMIETMSAQDKDALLNTVERLMGYGDISEFDIIDKIGTAKITTQMRMLANKKFRNEGNTELAIMHSYLSDATDPYVGNMSTLSDNVFAEPHAIEDIYNTYEQILFKLQEYKDEKAATAPKVINKKKLAESLAKLEDPAVQAIPAFTPGQKTMRWAGIGSRETPLPLLSKMTEVGEFLGKIGYVLHSGGAIGADMAFEGKPYPLALTAKEDIYNKKGEKIMSAGETVEPGSKTYTNAYYVFSDNKGGSNKFEKPTMSSVPAAKPRVMSFSANNVDNKARALAAAVHPGYNKMTPYQQDLMARNGYQVFGKDLDSPVDFVLFYAEETDNPLRPKGGTGQAVELARLKGIPTINMAEEGWGEKLREVIGLKKKSNEAAAQVEPLPVAPVSGSNESVVIDSNQTGLEYALTNPTHTSPKGYQWTKGDEDMRKYLASGIDYNGKHYADVEQAYQANNTRALGLPQDDNKDYALMVDLIEIKLNTFPRLVAGINKKGGLNYLNKVVHKPTGGKSRWETGNKDLFKKALIEAYNRVTSGGSIEQVKEDSLPASKVGDVITVSFLINDKEVNVKSKITSIKNISMFNTLLVNDKNKNIIVNGSPYVQYEIDLENISNGKKYAFIVDESGAVTQTIGARTFVGGDTTLIGFNPDSSEVSLELAKADLENRYSGYSIEYKYTNSGSNEQAEAPSPTPAKPIATSAKKGTNKYELSDGVYANGDQEAAIDDIKRFYKSKKQSFLLLGRGGTGKTTIIGKAIQELHLRASQLTFATPTHKARKVLEAANRKAGQRAPVTTIAKLLGIMKDDRDGKFKVMTKGKMNDSIKLIVVDEASMVGSATKKMLEDTATKYGAKIIYMGDNVQLPPVNDRGVNNELVQPLKESAVFAELANGDNYAQLKERMRQGTESPILPVTDVVAAEVEKGGSFAGLQFDGITRYDAKKDEGVIYSNEDEEVLLDQFIEDYKKDPMNTRWINYNNHMHDNTRALIIKIRNKLFGEEVAFNNEFIKGEQVFLTAKFGEDFDNGDEFQIESMSKPKDYTVQYSIWNDDIKRYIDKEITLNATMLSLKDQINGDVYDKMPMLTDDGMSELRSKIKNKKEFDKIMTNFLSLSYAYVINAHKSQGSTYRNVYVDFNNIKANSAFDQDTGLKALYVATSRPSKKLVIMGYDADKQAAPIINQPSRATDVSVINGAISMNDVLAEDADYIFGTNEDAYDGYVSLSQEELAIMNSEVLNQEQKDIILNNNRSCDK